MPQRPHHHCGGSYSIVGLSSLLQWCCCRGAPTASSPVTFSFGENPALKWFFFLFIFWWRSFLLAHCPVPSIQLFEHHAAWLWDEVGFILLILTEKKDYKQDSSSLGRTRQTFVGAQRNQETDAIGRNNLRSRVRPLSAWFVPFWPTLTQMEASTKVSA